MDGADGLPVQDDHEDRIDAINATHTEIPNSGMYALNSDTVSYRGVRAEVYTGGNIIAVAANRAGIDMFPEDAQNVEDLEHEVLVKRAITADKLFLSGGFIGSYYHGLSAYSPYYDPVWAAEASKMTGEKIF
jgi:hypothetical protein